MRTILFSLIVVLASPALAWKVDLSGLTPEIRETLAKKSPRLQEQDLSPEQVDRLLKRLQAIPSVKSASAVEDAPETLKIEVELFRRVGAVRFHGVNHMSESSARAALGLSSDDPFEMDALIEAAERLRVAYREIGVHNPVLDIETPETSAGVVDLDVKVKEGPVTRIASWTVTSSNEPLNTELRKALMRNASGPYTDQRVQNGMDLIREKLKDDRRLRVEIGAPETRFSADETTADIVVRLERSESYTVDFRGNREISSRSLENSVLDLENFTTANPNVTAELTEKIRQAYLERGFARVEVRAEESDGNRPFSRRITFDIDEGPRVRIERFEVRGRFSRDEKYYSSFVLNNSSKTVKSGFYNKKDLEGGFKNLVLELQNEGFLVAKIVSTRTQYSRDHSRITVHVNLDEGPLTVVDSVSFEGNVRIPSSELQGLLDLQPGGPLKLGQIERSKQLVRTHYRENGYIEMQIANENDDLVTYNADNTRAKLLFRIEEGPQVRVASILMDGNQFTQDRVILNELDFTVGDLLTPSKIEESISRLQRTGHFASVEIKTLEEKTAVDNRTVIVRVTERNPGVFTIGFGVTNEVNQNDFTLRGYSGIAYRNIQGTGRGVSLRVEGNYALNLQIPEAKATLGYLEPYLFNTRNRGRINLTRKRIIEDKDPNVVKISEANQYTYSVERDFTSHVIGTWDILSLATYNDFYRVADEPDTSLDIALTTLKLDVDYRDNPFNPMRGHFARFAVDYSSPKIGNKSADAFYRGAIGYNFYLNLPQTRVVWANSIWGRYLESLGQGEDGGVPYEKVGFFLGGRSTIRGFSEEELPSSTELGGTKSYRLRTVARSGVFKSEIRFPLWGDFLDGAVFYDGGEVRIDGLVFNDPYRDSAGIGLRYNTPVGPLSLEFGWKLDRKEGEEEGRFHLAVGAF